MLGPFATVKSAGEVANEDDEVSDDEEDDNEVEAGREASNEQEVEDAMLEVNEEYRVSEAQAKVARSSLTKVRDKKLKQILFVDCDNS